MFISAVNVKNAQVVEQQPGEIETKPKSGCWTVLKAKTKKELQEFHKKLKDIHGDIGTETIISIN